jgi:excisionase family DNA binding protein
MDLQEPTQKRKRVNRPNISTDRSHLRPAEYAARLGISRSVLDDWMDDGIIPFVKIGNVVLINIALADDALAKLTTYAKQEGQE